MEEQIDAEIVANDLEQKGYWFSKNTYSHAQYEQVCSQLGHILERYDVCITEGAERDVNRTTKILFHTDGRVANYVAWRCIWSGHPIVASKILNINDIVEQLSKQELLEVMSTNVIHEGPSRGHRMKVPIVQHGKESGYTLSFSGVWGRQESEQANKTVSLFCEAIERAQHKIRRFGLQNGQMLFINNHTTIHGRDELTPGHERHLKRIWIKK